MRGTGPTAVLVAFTLLSPLAAEPAEEGDPMPRHAFTRFEARVQEQGVRLSFYLTTPVFQARRGDRPVPPIRIRRKALPRFTFGKHYAEYLDGLAAEGSKTIFEGRLDAINGRKFAYVDETATVGVTYAYWVSCSLGRLPTGPAAVRVRDPRVWWPHNEVRKRLTAMAEKHPDLVTLKTYGRTVGGRSIVGLRAGNRERAVALVGTIHAGESGPELVIPAVERLLAEEADLLKAVGVAVLPNVNIDQRERLVQGCPWYLRTNARGVDLNRNFDANWKRVERGYGLVSSDPDSMTYRGPKPASEPETRAVVAFLKDVKPKAVFSYHALASITGARFLAPRAAEDDADYARRCKAVVAPFVRAFYPGKRWNAGIGYGASAGSLPAYAYHTLGAPGFDLEWDGNPDAKPSHIDKTTPDLLKTYQDRHDRGLVAVLRALTSQ